MANTMQPDTISIYRTAVGERVVYTGGLRGDGTTGPTVTVLIDNPDADDKDVAIVQGVVGKQILTSDGTSVTRDGHTIHNLADPTGQRVYSLRFETSRNGTRWARVRPSNRTPSTELARQLKLLKVA